jgi:hypothetical protein
MKSSYINTQKKIISKGVSFPEFSGNTEFVFYSNSTGYTPSFKNYTSTKNKIFYSVCIDWLQFVCTIKNSTRLFSKDKDTGRIYSEKITVHKNPNFRLLHKIIFDGNEVCDVYSEPNNPVFEQNEVLIKIANPLLYQSGWCATVNYVLGYYGLEFNRLTRLDIALDGEDILKIIDLLNKFTRSHTVQIGNGAIKVRGLEFCKQEHRWLSFSIGRVKSGISVTVYDKSTEINDSGKGYIKDLWLQNGIESEMVGRLEIQLSKNRLRRCNIRSLEALSSGEYLCSILESHLRPWLKFYSVRKKHILNHRKEVAINKGHEIRYIKWNHLPHNITLLPIFDYVSDSTYFNARNYISFGLKEIRKAPDELHDDEIRVIRDYAHKYNLEDYLMHKIRLVFGSNPDAMYCGFISKLSGAPGEKQGTTPQ